MGASGSSLRARILGALVAATMAAMLLLIGLSQAPASGLTQEEQPDASCLGSIWTTFTVGTQSGFTPAQTFTAVNTGRLTTTRVMVGDVADVGDLVVEIRAVDASGLLTDVVLASASIPASAINNTAGSGGESTTVAWYDASFDPGAEVVSGQQYALVLSTSEETSYLLGVNDLNPCPGGQAYRSMGGGPFEPQGSYDLRFNTYVTPAPTPMTKADCRKGGWREFGYPDQGTCIRDVNRRNH
jgi:hypothetical protein